jgi:hypothetical protein
VLRNHEESIQANRTSIFTATTKIHENEQQVVTQVATIMGTLVQQKCQMAVLEAECNMLWNMVINMSKGDQSRGLESGSVCEFKLWKTKGGRDSAST